jgi:hypothetical protein
VVIPTERSSSRFVAFTRFALIVAGLPVDHEGEARSDPGRISGPGASGGKRTNPATIVKDGLFAEHIKI